MELRTWKRGINHTPHADAWSLHSSLDEKRPGRGRNLVGVMRCLTSGISEVNCLNGFPYIPMCPFHSPIAEAVWRCSNSVHRYRYIAVVHVYRILYGGMDPLRAVSDSRLHDQWEPDRCLYENFTLNGVTYTPNPAVIAGLAARVRHMHDLMNECVFAVMYDNARLVSRS